ncbi:MAG: hypothetical protein WA948_09705 [Pontixanthobacter sp.]
MFLAAGLLIGTTGTQVAITPQEPMCVGETYNFFPTPPCENRVAEREPWLREWSDFIEAIPGDTVQFERLILRETKHA